MPQSLWYNILTNAKETSMETINQILARELGREQSHIDNVIKLLDEGNTIPFIARYRKELHGAMDDTALRTLEDRLAVSAQSRPNAEGEVKKSHRRAGQADGRSSAAAIDAAADARGGGGSLPPLQAEAPHPRDRRPRKGARAAGGAALCAGARLPPSGGSSGGLRRPGKGRGDSCRRPAGRK